MTMSLLEKVSCARCGKIVAGVGAYHPCARTLRLEVLGPPVACGRPRIVRFGRGQHGFARAITPKTTEDYQKLIADRARQAMISATWPVAGVGPFVVEVDVYRAARRGDLDNFAKSALDGLTKAGVWDDDKRVVELRARMFDAPDRPRMWIEVRERLKEGATP